MTCQQYEADLIDLARGTLADGSTEASVRRHLGACTSCEARFEREQALTAGLRALAAATVVPANDIGEHRLMEAFAASPGLSSPAGRRWPVVRWPALAAAACVLFLLGTWAAIEWRSRTAAPEAVAAAVQTAAAAPQEERRPVAQVVSPVPASALSVARANRAPGPRAVRAARRDEPPQDTDRLAGFIPLPAADGLPGFDSGMIVRVALPTASLPAFGLAIAPEAAQMVNADLLVGQDGQARAIRFVNLVGGSRREPQ